MWSRWAVSRGCLSGGKNGTTVPAFGDMNPPFCVGRFFSPLHTVRLHTFGAPLTRQRESLL